METQSQKWAEANTLATPSSSSGSTTRTTKRARLFASNAAIISSSTTSLISMTQSKDSIVSSTLMDPTPEASTVSTLTTRGRHGKIAIKILITELTPIQIKVRRKSMKAGLGIVKGAQG
ncbi:E3 ubiquitin-protein ligase UPL3-like [Abeliophyllum distichum]|uniref:E3 ubiquitin-protein ligase UPL3-like n=1 Tax=Abeliophyllum distichum TaxID=126358 RepID=A0ABD1R9E6_9LAMI